MWKEVDLTASRLAVVRALQRQRGRGLVFVEPKSAKSRRSVHLAQVTCDALREHLVTQQQVATTGLGWSDRGLVFPNRRGEPQESSSVTSALAQALQKAGLRDIRVHDLRHTTASILLEAGIHAKIVQDVLGHSTVSLTLDTYSHLTDTLSCQAAETIDVLLS